MAEILDLCFSECSHFGTILSCRCVTRTVQNTDCLGISDTASSSSRSLRCHGLSSTHWCTWIQGCSAWGHTWIRGRRAWGHTWIQGCRALGTHVGTGSQGPGTHVGTGSRGPGTHMGTGTRGPGTHVGTGSQGPGDTRRSTATPEQGFALLCGVLLFLQ